MVLMVTKVLSSLPQPIDLMLDNALLRPGRFDEQVVIDLPDLEGREAILKVHAKKIKLSDDVDLNSLARATAGFSGAISLIYSMKVH